MIPDDYCCDDCVRKHCPDWCPVMRSGHGGAIHTAELSSVLDAIRDRYEDHDERRRVSDLVRRALTGRGEE